MAILFVSGLLQKSAWIILNSLKWQKKNKLDPSWIQKSNNTITAS